MASTIFKAHAKLGVNTSPYLAERSSACIAVVKATPAAILKFSQAKGTLGRLVKNTALQPILIEMLCF